MRFKLLLLVVVLSLFLIAPGAAVGAKAKQACKAPKVPVTVGKRTTCQSVAKAFPKPKALDARLFYLQRALSYYPRKAAGGAKRKRAQRKLLKALPKVLAYVDRRKGAKAGASGAGYATASAACEAGVGGPAATVGGVRVSISGPNGAVLETTSGRLTVKLRYGVCGSSSFAIPECPTAAGDLDASSSTSGELVVEVWEGTDRLVERARTNFESKAKAKGKVGPDAKLKHIELSYTHDVFVVASGGVVRRGKSERKVRIAMPGGNYDATGAQAKISGDADAVAKDGFEGVAKEAIEGFRRAEPRWSSFESRPHCAEPVFAPATGSLKLRKGDSGQLGVSAKARTGGTAAEARWTLLGAENAEFSPGSSDQATPSFSYKVTNAPNGGFVKVTVKFTSTAGVGEGSWIQPTEQGSVDRISGTFGMTTAAFGSVYTIAGNATFERFGPNVFGGPNGNFKFASGLYTVTASGNGTLFFSAPLCSQRGSAQFPVDNGEFFALGTPPSFEAPYEYSFQLGSGAPLPEMQVELYDCAPPAEEQEGFYTLAVPLEFGAAAQTSSDGTSFSGSESESEAGLAVERSWSFTAGE
ncbi:MAG: hypothetical protein M3Y75_12180 [Actinomycetota bacterium]|nr:hypothetical protein [Actinomycetota bacterium]